MNQCSKKRMRMERAQANQSMSKLRKEKKNKSKNKSDISYFLSGLFKAKVRQGKGLGNVSSCNSNSCSGQVQNKKAAHPPKSKWLTIASRKRQEVSKVLLSLMYNYCSSSVISKRHFAQTHTHTLWLRGHFRYNWSLITTVICDHVADDWQFFFCQWTSLINISQGLIALSLLSCPGKKLCNVLWICFTKL